LKNEIKYHMKICILGGGTAGWTAALYIQKRQPEHEIVVVESSRIGIIGTGEGSTGLFADVMSKVLKISVEDFLINTGATQKLGNRFHNWQGNGRSFIAPLDNTHTSLSLLDTTLLYHCRYVGKDQTHLTTQCGQLADRGLTSFRHDGGEVLPIHGYHFDGHLVGAYFRQLSVAQGATVVDSEYTHCERSENGSVTAIHLANGESIEADVYVDATGFARCLGREVGAGWHSYSDSLSCDRAMPFHLPHLPTVDALTEAHALDSGWMWRIPVQQRRGCGYVFDSDFITPDQAQEEIETVLGHSIDPIKVIKFEAGRVERTFCHNVATIGLAGCFLEPLQATNLHGTLIQIHNMVEFWLRPWGPAGQVESDHLNREITRVFDDFANLIQIHYHSGRSDTEFWRYQQTIPLLENAATVKEICQHRWPTQDDWRAKIGGAGYGVSIYPMIEYGWLDRAIEREVFRDPTAAEQQYRREVDYAEEISRGAMSNTVLVNRLRAGQVRNPPVSIAPDLRRLLELGR
jgi:tryptophan halogenase